MSEYPYTYRWNPRSWAGVSTPDRKGQHCRIIARSSTRHRGCSNTILLEFEDGHRTTTSGWAIRRRDG